MMHKGAVTKELAKYDIKKMMKAYYNQVKKKSSLPTMVF